MATEAVEGVSTDEGEVWYIGKMNKNSLINYQKTSRQRLPYLPLARFVCMQYNAITHHILC